jgi:hypothetical protein
MRRAVIISAVVHAIVLVFVVIGMPHFFRAKPPDRQAIAVEMVTSDKMAPAPKPDPKPEPPKVETAPPQPPPLPEPKPQRVETPPPPPPPPMPEPKPRVVEAPPPAPQPPAPKPPTPEVAAVTPEKIPAPAPAPMPKPKPAPPQPEAKPTPPAPPAKPKPQQQAKQDPFDAMLKNLEKQKQQIEQTQSREPQRPQPPSPPPQPQVTAGPPRQAVSPIDQRRAASELGKLIQDQVTPCWNIPIGSKGVRDLQVGMSIDLNPDGTLRGNPAIADTARYETDTTFRAVADSALRALRNPRCSPLKLPYDQYEMWKHINLTFTPPEGV